jgi:hypothetical protein
MTHMTRRTLKSLSDRLGQLEARLVQIDKSQNELRGSTDYEARRQRSNLILEGEDIEAELLQLRSAAAVERSKTQNGI